MEITFLGTASCFPTPDRGVSCTALQKDGAVWLFDCGEGSQIQLQKSKVKPGKIKKIFITHLHGDHLFGLPGLMCTISQSGPILLDDCLEIYGPRGLREYVRRSLQLSYSLLGYNYVVHELMFHELGMESAFSKPVECPVKPECSTCQMHPNEMVGRDIHIESELNGLICKGNSCSVFAAPLSHRAPCVGFVIKEDDLPGKLDVNKLKAKGLSPGPVCSRLKTGESVTLPNGDIIRPDDVVGSSRRGRKVVILGDTQDSSKIVPHSHMADVVVHEATYDNSMEEKAKEHGHSTAGMAAQFAMNVQAKTLLLTHFSQRYRVHEDTNPANAETTDILVEEAKAVFDGTIVAAYDFMSYKIELPL